MVTTGDTWWQNDGDGTFSPILLTMDLPWARAAADLDGDGDLDIVGWTNTWAQNGGDDLGGGDGTVFALQTAGPDSIGAVGDVDGDGDIDLLTADFWGAPPTWLENDGTAGGWASHPLGGGAGWFIVAGDLDADGDLDVFVNDPVAGQVVHQNGGDAQGGGDGSVWTTWPLSSIDIGFGGCGPNHLALLDLDGDGDNEVVAREENTLWYHDNVVAWVDEESCDDLDGDGVALAIACLLPGGDCDDLDPTVGPGFPEIAGVDATPANPTDAPAPNTAAAGRAEAEADLAAGTIHLRYFGELMGPQHVDRKTGLPQASMGCEVDPDATAYLEAYNQTVHTWLESNDPFPDDLEVRWRVTGPELDETLTIGRRSASWTAPGNPTVWPEERLRIGVLSQRAMGRNVPATMATSDLRESIAVQTGDQSWQATWEPGKPLVDPVLVAALELIRARR